MSSKLIFIDMNLFLFFKSASKLESANDQPTAELEPRPVRRAEYAEGYDPELCAQGISTHCR